MEIGHSPRAPTEALRRRGSGPLPLANALRTGELWFWSLREKRMNKAKRVVRIRRFGRVAHRKSRVEKVEIPPDSSLEVRGLFHDSPLPRCSDLLRVPPALTGDRHGDEAFPVTTSKGATRDGLRRTCVARVHAIHHPGLGNAGTSVCNGKFTPFQ